MGLFAPGKVSQILKEADLPKAALGKEGSSEHRQQLCGGDRWICFWC